METSSTGARRSVRARWRGPRRRGTNVMAMVGGRTIEGRGMDSGEEEEEGRRRVSGVLFGVWARRRLRRQ